MKTWIQIFPLVISGIAFSFAPICLIIILLFLITNVQKSKKYQNKFKNGILNWDELKLTKLYDFCNSNLIRWALWNIIVSWSIQILFFAALVYFGYVSDRNIISKNIFDLFSVLFVRFSWFKISFYCFETTIYTIFSFILKKYLNYKFNNLKNS